MRLDSHHHFWKYSPRDYGWIDGSMTALRRDFSPSDLEPLLRRNGFDGSVLVQVRQSREETEWMLDLADRHPFVRGVVGWVDLRSASLRRDLEKLRAHPRLVGLRHVVQDEPDDRFLLREDFLRGFSLLAELGLTYDILVYHRQLPAVVELVGRFPDHRLVLDHIGKPAIARGELETWAREIRELGRFPNLYCKLSGMVTEADWRNWKKTDFTPYLDAVLEAFGPRRLLVGSDWPVCTLAASYEEVLEIVADFIDPLSPDEKRAIWGETAAELYRLEDRSHES
jgi:L-fucono-1,5-lactonase